MTNDADIESNDSRQGYHYGRCFIVLIPLEFGGWLIPEGTVLKCTGSTKRNDLDISFRYVEEIDTERRLACTLRRLKLLVSTNAVAMLNTKESGSDREAWKLAQKGKSTEDVLAAYRTAREPAARKGGGLSAVSLLRCVRGMSAAQRDALRKALCRPGLDDDQ